MADDRALVFEKRAYENYREEMEDIEKIAGELQKRVAGELDGYRQPLSLDERREITVLLSWGGPSDGYRICFDGDNEPLEAYYVFADWFGYEEFKLTDEELDRVLTVYQVAPGV